MSDFDFDEGWYVQRYPDVATAIEAGNIKSGLEHYMAHGREEGRKASSADQFDPNWYSKAYPIVREELPFADATELESHYRQIGRYRGYLPTRDAKRAENPAALASAFGGLWIDAANAHDLIDGKHEIGVINSVEAKQLKSFINDGYIVLNRLFHLPYSIAPKKSLKPLTPANIHNCDLNVMDLIPNISTGSRG